MTYEHKSVKNYMEGRSREGILQWMQDNDYTPFKTAFMFITRRCFRDCRYCGATLKGFNEKPASFWDEVFSWLRSKGNQFSLILGDDLFVYKDWRNLVPVLAQYNWDTNWDYGIYTTLFNTKLIDEAVALGLNNISGGCDSSPSVHPMMGKKWQESDSKKSVDVYKIMKYVTEKHPQVQRLPLVTIHQYNLKFLPQILKELSFVSTRIGINIMHFDIVPGDRFNFAAGSNRIEDMLVNWAGEEWKQYIDEAIEVSKDPQYHIQAPIEYLEALRDKPEIFWALKWKCRTPVVSIDEDGSLMLCGYRKVHKGPNVTELMEGRMSDEEFFDWWYPKWDACLGCAWSYPFYIEHNYNIMNFRDQTYWDARNAWEAPH